MSASNRPNRPHREEGFDAALVRHVPEHMREAIVNWIDGKTPPKMLGHFLYALLCHDLWEAFARADEANANSMRGWVLFLHNYAPSTCHGSAEKLETYYAYRPRRDDAESDQ